MPYTKNEPNVLPKVYKALLTQSGTDAPVATVLENTLSGTPVWSYTNVGLYRLTLNGEWSANKTGLFALNVSDGIGFGFTQRLDNDQISLNTKDTSLANSNDILSESLIVIEVYP
jgi:hypothetical protein